MSIWTEVVLVVLVIGGGGGFVLGCGAGIRWLFGDELSYDLFFLLSTRLWTANVLKGEEVGRGP